MTPMIKEIRNWFLGGIAIYTLLFWLRNIIMILLVYLVFQFIKLQLDQDVSGYKIKSER